MMIAIILNIIRSILLIGVVALIVYLYSIAWFLKRYEVEDYSQFPTKLKSKLNEFTPDYLTDILVKKAKKISVIMIIGLLLIIATFLL